ncbi:hypothetical protein K504DRAFT_455839 [Pleomassaria siparia CBS 279.74]|uniref:F-box domain-containing protein n=1 Tax=Pleomassaria siparia CBS 279.74 TaxID=1314801 RepID=A0A6G1K810_9PLEO|nr:hypothetical protein K504DRAFT_455839 [Pleomassaria siparia CBS 279.74]
MLFKDSKNHLALQPSEVAFDPRVAPSLPPPQTAPICSLPIELVQEIRSYLPNPDVASFCLSTRQIYYAVGTGQLSTFLSSSPNKYSRGTKIERRKNMEILERAFPSHWYCAWCDKFHAQDKEGGPKEADKETERACAKCNSFLHGGEGQGYVLRHHHVRLAINHEVWGPEYGIPLSAFRYYNSMATVKVLKRDVEVSLWCDARVRGGRLILAATFKMWIPQTIMSDPKWLDSVWPQLPQIVVGHRDSHHGHSGLRTTLKDDKLRNKMQLCSVCATDFVVERMVGIKQSDGSYNNIVLIHVWRDLGDGRSPFEASWRAHGEIGESLPGFGGDVVRLTNFQAGDFKQAWHTEGPLTKSLVDGKMAWEEVDK